MLRSRIALVCVIIAIWPGCQDSSKERTGEMPHVAAWIEGQPVNVSDLLINLDVFLMDRGLDPPRDQKELDHFIQECLNELAKDMAIVSGAKELNLTSDEFELDPGTLIEYQDEFPAGFIALQTDLKKWEQRAESRLRVMMLASRIAEMLARDIQITDKTLQDAYAQQSERWIKPMMLEVRIIRVFDEDLAKDILKKLRRGWSFLKLAENYSTYRNDEFRGEIVRMAVTEFPMEFQEELGKLKPGRISPVLTIGKGFYIYRMEKKNPEHVLSLEDVSETLRNERIATEGSRRFRVWLKSRLSDIEIKMGTPIPFKGVVE